MGCCTARMRCIALTAALAAAAPIGADTPGDFRPQFQPTLEIRPAAGPIRIDGALDDAGWQGAARATGFAEVSPGDQIAPPVETETWVTYDAKNLYLAFVAQDDPAAVRVSLRERDQIWHDDYVGLMLDTYGDHNWGYEFFVNPLGIQGDLRMHSGGEEDISYDLIWFSRGQVTERGYQVEVAIPFASLRYPRRDVQSWRVNFWRDHQRDVRRQIAWAATNRDDPCWMCQWGTLTGIRGIDPPRHLEAIASAVGTVTGERREGPSPRGLRYADPRGEMSLNLRYALTSTSNAELTINPDFSQIESDAGRIDVNEPFTLNYEEKRPFFLEGSELYRTWLPAVYTRSISNPSVAGKLLGSQGRTSLAWTFARDEDALVILPLEERDFRCAAGPATVNLVRIQQAFGTDNRAGVILTDRRLKDGGSGTLAGVDGAVRLRRNWRLRALLMASHTREPKDTTLTAGEAGDLTFDYGRHTLAFDGEHFDGHAVYAALDRNGRTWNSWIEFDERHPSFRADNGFITRNDYRYLGAWNGLTFQPNGAHVVSWQPSLMLARIWDYEGRFQDEWVMAGLEAQLKRQTTLEIEGLLSRERFRGRIFPGIRRATLSASTRPSEALGLAAELEFGRSIYRDFDPAVEPFLGRIVNLDLEANLKLLTWLTLENHLAYARMKEPDGDTVVYDGWILRNRLDLQVSREASVRLVTEYNDLDQRFAFEPLLTYRLNAFSLLYLGMADAHGRFPTDPDLPEGPREWDLGARQIFGKIQYLARI